jgi:NADPH2:quinone reductase
MYAIRIEATGGPEVLTWTEVEEPVPGPTDLLVDVAAAGVNFIDTYHRGGLYQMEVPFIPGLEGAGTVSAVGAEVHGFHAGDRIAWTNALGSYAERHLVPMDQAVAIPADVPLETAAAAMLQGLTAHYLITDTYPLQEGERCLIHAGAGGVGRLLIQLAKRVGAEVFTTVGSAEKADLATRAGADHVINYRETAFAEAVEGIAGPRPLHVVYDGVGAATFEDGLRLLRRRGMMVTFGNASGPVPEISPLRLVDGSLYLTRPTLFDYIADQESLLRRAADLFDWIALGDLDVHIGARFPLAEAADAHRALEGRETTGKVLLVP